VISPRLTGAWATRPTNWVEDAHRRLRAGSGLDHRVDNCCQNKPNRQSQQSSTKPLHSHGRRVPCVGSQDFDKAASSRLEHHLRAHSGLRQERPHEGSLLGDVGLSIRREQVLVPSLLPPVGGRLLRM